MLGLSTMSAEQTPDTSRALEGLLRWYAAMGVDAAVDEAPHDRFAASEPAEAPSAPRNAAGRSPATAARPLPTARLAPSTDGALTSAEDLVRQAEASAAGAADLDALRERWAALPGCGLGATSRMIFAAGTAGSPLMLIGAAPESDDERQGEAFAGAHGRLLDAMLRAIGLDRAGVYLTNVIPWRPPGNRVPTPLELALCLPFTRRHIALANPAVLLCLGERAAQPLLGSREPISRLRGRWLTHEGDTRTVRTLVTFSPDYLLKQPLQKRRAWADLQILEAELAGG
jgi:DNA polymerase